MSVNKYRPHVHVLPEDKANEDIANGFLLNSDLEARRIRVLAPAGGWSAVVEKFLKFDVLGMKKYPERRFVLLLDLDDVTKRLEQVKSRIPAEVCERTFILSITSEPESLKRELNRSYERIGKDLAKECAEQSYDLWRHDLLIHDEPELQRMDAATPPLREILFPGRS